MAIIFHEYDRYSIEGKIIDINDSSTLTIYVTSPFPSEIEFRCSSEYYNTLHPPATSKYNWIDWVGGDGHPSLRGASVYYNISHKCFYKKESGRESKWERADFEDIYNDDDPHLFVKHLDMPEKYNFFLSKYKPILHKGQLCSFSAYAIDRTDTKLHSIRGKKVERHPEDYLWVYDPDTFYGEKWDAESIDGLVKEIRPSRDCLKHLLKSYKTDDRKAWSEKLKKIWQGIKSTPERFHNWLTKYNQIWYFFATFLAGALGTLIATLIINRNK